MVHQSTYYPTPPDARITVTPDSNPDFPMIAQPGVDISGNACQIVYFPDGYPNGSGLWIDIEADGYVPLKLHGIVYLYEDGKAWSGYDIFVLQKKEDVEPLPPPVDPDDSDRTPQEIMAGIPANLGTVAGCGIYTEDSVDALHNEHGPWWGHIAKYGAEHQYNGHAVDAAMLLVATKGVPAGIYDIVKNSSSPEAEKAFNYVEPIKPELWYYPADAYAMGFRRMIRLQIGPKRR